jgi:hypothetical protein
LARNLPTIQNNALLNLKSATGEMVIRNKQEKHQKMNKLFFVLLFAFFIPQYAYTQAPPWTSVIAAGMDCTSIVVDADNNLYFSCWGFMYAGESSAFIDTLALDIVDPENAFSFIAKTDTLYNIEWIRIIETAGVVHEPIIRIDQDNNILIAAKFGQNIRMGKYYVYESSGKSGGFIVKIGSDAKFKWMKTIESDSYGVNLTGLEIDSDNNIHVCGGYASQLSFGGAKTISSNRRTSFLASYSPDGTFKRAISLNTSGELYLKSIAVDDNKNIFATGWMTGTYNYVDSSVTAGSSDILIAGYDSLFNAKWVRSIGAKYNSIMESGYAVAFDRTQNHLYVTGQFLQGDFGNGLIQADDKNIFLVKYNVEGSPQWVKKFGHWSGASSHVESGTALYADQQGAVYLGGVLGRNGQFDDITLSAYRNPNYSNFYHDFFIAKILTNGRVVWVTQAGTESDGDVVCSIVKDHHDNLFAAGRTRHSARFDPHIFTPSYPILGNGFIARIKEEPTILSTFNPTDEFNGIQVFPNPASDKLTINAPECVNLSISLYDSNGRAVLTHEVSGETGLINLDVSHLKPGLYLVLITCNNSLVITERILVM